MHIGTPLIYLRNGQGKKVPFWQFFRKADMAPFNLCMKIKKRLVQMISFEVVKNSQFIPKVPLALSKCLFRWIKVDK